MAAAASGRVTAFHRLGLQQNTSFPAHSCSCIVSLLTAALACCPCCAGLGGICPGPGLVALASLQPKAFLFIAAMLVRHCLWAVGPALSWLLANARRCRPVLRLPSAATHPLPMLQLGQRLDHTVDKVVCATK